VVFNDIKMSTRFIRNISMKQRTSSWWIRTCAILLVSFAAGNATTVSGDDPATVLIIVNDATPPEAGTNGIGASVWVGQRDRKGAVSREFSESS
jgi:hypothetical protein